MANVIKCDRCGKIFDKESYELYASSNTYRKRNKLVARLRDSKYNLIGTTLKTYDLCYDCYSRVISFIEGEDK